MASGRQRGIDRERRVAFSLRAEGWTVVRAAGSLGVADLVAGKDGRTMLVEGYGHTPEPTYEQPIGVRAA